MTYAYNRYKSTTVYGKFSNELDFDSSILPLANFNGDVSMNERLFVAGDASMNGNVYVGKSLRLDNGNCGVYLGTNSDVIVAGQNGVSLSCKLNDENYVFVGDNSITLNSTGTQLLNAATSIQITAPSVLISENLTVGNELFFSDGTSVISATGLQGIQGVKGDTGLQGIQGVKGDTGLQGIQGIQGVKGDTGLQGIQGIQGVKGDTGLQGIQGVTGDTGLQGIQGIQGIAGTNGTNGTNGADGTSILGTLNTFTNTNTFTKINLTTVLPDYSTTSEAATTTFVRNNITMGSLGNNPIYGSISNLTSLGWNTFSFVFLHIGWRFILYSSTGFSGSSIILTNVFNGAIIGNNGSTTCSFYGSVLSGVLTITSMVSGSVNEGMIITFDIAGSSSIVAQTSGTGGGAGTYTLSSGFTWLSGTGTKPILFTSNMYGNNTTWGSIRVYDGNSTQHTVQNG